MKEKNNKDSKVNDLKNQIKNNKSKGLEKKATSLSEMAEVAGLALPEINEAETLFPGGLQVQSLRIGISHPTQTFIMPDEEQAKEVIGIIIPWGVAQVNAYWEHDISEMGAGIPPDCFSSNGLVPDSERKENDDCASCKHNQFGSDEGGRGKRCKNMIRLYILIDEEPFPVCLSLPPSSIRAYENYGSQLLGKYRYFDIVTKITLEKKTNNQGISFSGAVFENLGFIHDYYNENEAISKCEVLIAIAKQKGKDFVAGQIKEDPITAGEFDPLKKNEGDPY